jgi:hypothetical protein
MEYEKPELQVLGSLSELTEGSVGMSPDVGMAGSLGVSNP